jgi:hypothetical protein
MACCLERRATPNLPARPIVPQIVFPDAAAPRTATSGARAHLRAAAPARLVRKVARVVREMPLLRLQRTGAEQLNFLYEN